LTLAPSVTGCAERRDLHIFNGLAQEQLSSRLTSTVRQHLTNVAIGIP